MSEYIDALQAVVDVLDDRLCRTPGIKEANAVYDVIYVVLDMIEERSEREREG